MFTCLPVSLVFIFQESDTASGPAADDSGYENSFLSQVKEIFKIKLVNVQLLAKSLWLVWDFNKGFS